MRGFPSCTKSLYMPKKLKIQVHMDTLAIGVKTTEAAHINCQRNCCTVYGCASIVCKWYCINRAARICYEEV
ncbi:unnamed protein product [Caretta caretta]